MPLEKREFDECKKERRIWLSVSIVSALVFIWLMITALKYDIRPIYGIYLVVLTYFIMFCSFVMYSFTEYISTREFVSILVKKTRGSIDKEQK